MTRQTLARLDIIAWLNEKTQTLARLDIIDEGLNDKTQTFARQDILLWLNDEGLNDKTRHRRQLGRILQRNG